jgi:hypothetical protein
MAQMSTPLLWSERERERERVRGRQRGSEIKSARARASERGRLIYNDKLYMFKYNKIFNPSPKNVVYRFALVCVCVYMCVCVCVCLCVCIYTGGVLVKVNYI